MDRYEVNDQFIDLVPSKSGSLVYLSEVKEVQKESNRIKAMMKKLHLSAAMKGDVKLMRELDKIMTLKELIGDK